MKEEKQKLDIATLEFLIELLADANLHYSGDEFIKSEGDFILGQAYYKDFVIGIISGYISSGEAHVAGSYKKDKK